MLKTLKVIFLLQLVLIYGCNENSVDPTDKFEVEVIDARVVSVTAVALSSDGNYLAWVGFENDISLKGKPKLKSHIGLINSLDFIDVGSLLLSGSADHNIKIWDVDKLVLKLARLYSTVTVNTRHCK